MTVQTVTSAAPVTPPVDTDPFADAFANLSALKDDASSLAITAVLQGQEPPPTAPTGPTGAPAPIVGPTGTSGDAPTADELAAAAIAAAETGPTGPTGAVAPVAGPTGVAPAPAPGVDAKSFNELISALKGAAAPVDDGVRAPVQAQPAPLTAEETEALNTYVSEFPQVAAAHQIVMRRQLEATTNYVLAEVASVLQPMLQRLEMIGQRSHLGDLETAVPDYAAVRQPVIDWVETQPTYLRNAYRSVIQQGTVDEVKDLVDRYRGATGKPLVAPATPQAPVAELPPAAKKAAAALAQVSSKRSTVTTSAPTDFDGAFDSFAKDV
jgi:hypothetical protein